MKYAQAALEANEAIEAAKQEKYRRVREAEQSFNQVSAPHTETLDKLIEQFQDKAFEIAKRAGKPPFNPNGCRMQPDNVYATAQGIEMTWDDSNYYVHHVATWDQMTLEDEHAA